MFYLALPLVNLYCIFKRASCKALSILVWEHQNHLAWSFRQMTLKIKGTSFHLLLFWRLCFLSKQFTVWLGKSQKSKFAPFKSMHILKGTLRPSLDYRSKRDTLASSLPMRPFWIATESYVTIIILLCKQMLSNNWSQLLSLTHKEVKEVKSIKSSFSW